jgi:hypothetical protein
VSIVFPFLVSFSGCASNRKLTFRRGTGVQPEVRPIEGRSPSHRVSVLSIGCIGGEGAGPPLAAVAADNYEGRLTRMGLFRQPLKRACLFSRAYAPSESLVNAGVKMQKKSTYDKATEYEDFVADIYRSILLAEQIDGKIKGVTLERQKPLLCKSGTTTKVDIYWEYEVAETAFRTAIECKNYEGGVPVSELRDFAHKLGDIAGNPIQGLCVAKCGFQSGAEKVADHAGIKLMNLREVEERDWEGYLQGVDIKVPIMRSPGVILYTIEMRIDLTKEVSAILEYVGETSKKFTITRKGEKQSY